jgi:hypothetical protein
MRAAAGWRAAARSNARHRSESIENGEINHRVLSCISHFSDEEGGIELQILSNAIGSGMPPDHSSRTSVEHHSQSDELSCANSAVSVDFPEQLASTIGMNE